MTAPVDALVTWITRVLGFLPDSFVAFLWLPVLMVVLILVIRAFLRLVLPRLIGIVEKAVNFILAVLAAPFMALLVVIAAPMRRLKLNPPNVMLAFDDAIVATTTVAAGGLRRTVGVAGKLSKANILVVIALSVAIVWRWNAVQCDQAGLAYCTTPVAEWAATIGINIEGERPAPDGTPSPSLTPGPTDSPVPPQ